jgi:hypothetical protein
MIAVVVALATTCVVLAVMLGLTLSGHTAEREAWTAERQRLVDRVIARHAGEALALDRSATHVVANATTNIDRPVAVGL